MSDRNMPWVAPGAERDKFADDQDEVIEEEPTQLGGETMSDGRVPADGDMMSNHQGVHTNRRTE